ncbi:hypothetical protein ABID65_009684, partial [Bradyrhizobium sp. S3.9.2]
APPIARCSHRAKRRNIRRDSNRYWVKLQGQVIVSQVALAMFLDGDEAALAAYHAGDHSNLRVVRYVDRFGVPLPKPSKCPE